MTRAKRSGPQNKRLIVACDGTWLNSDRAWQGVSWLPDWLTGGSGGALETVPSNVTRICRSVAHADRDGTPQICYYQAGVGSDDSLAGHVWGGLTGAGLSENIREAYSFIQANWEPGDDILLLGFSRGAFTARSVGSFIAAAGILTREGMSEFQDVFYDYEHQLYKDDPPRWPRNVKEIKRPRFEDPAYQKELVERGTTNFPVPISAIAVWDTVGSLGIPAICPFTSRKELSFMSPFVPPNVHHAFQALALDEQREAYLPSIWASTDDPESQLKELTQCWFPGVHSSIGGSYSDKEIADMTLAWMIGKLEARGLVAFEPDFLIEMRELSALSIAGGVSQTATRDWSLGKIYDSMSGIFRLAPRAVRTPGRNCVTDPDTDVMTEELLLGTGEMVHPSVRVRMSLGGAGVGDDPVYEPAALKGWKVVRSQPSGRRGTRSSRNAAPFKWVSPDGELELPEERLEGLELKLLEKSPKIYKTYMESLEQAQLS